MHQPFITKIQRHLINPLARQLTHLIPGQAVVETIGRTSGLPRKTPIGASFDGETFYWVSEFGRNSHYVRNIEKNPKVRMQWRGKWYEGTATILDADDPHSRLQSLPKFNSTIVRKVGRSLLTLRVDVDQKP